MVRSAERGTPQHATRFVWKLQNRQWQIFRSQVLSIYHIGLSFRSVYSITWRTVKPSGVFLLRPHSAPGVESLWSALTGWIHSLRTPSSMRGYFVLVEAPVWWEKGTQIGTLLWQFRRCGNLNQTGTNGNLKVWSLSGFLYLDHKCLSHLLQKCILTEHTPWQANIWCCQHPPSWLLFNFCGDWGIGKLFFSNKGNIAEKWDKCFHNKWRKKKSNCISVRVYKI